MRILIEMILVLGLIGTLVTDGAVHTGRTGTDMCPCLERSQAEWEDRAVSCPSSQLKQHQNERLKPSLRWSQQEARSGGSPIIPFPMVRHSTGQGSEDHHRGGGWSSCWGSPQGSLLYGPWGGVRVGEVCSGKVLKGGVNV